MKYRVKYKCYWYNTGQGDNHYYIEMKILIHLKKQNLSKQE